MNQVVNRQWCLARRPVGPIKESDFAWREESLPVPGPGQILVRTRYLSLGTTERWWMREEDTYLPAQRPGEVVRGVGVGSVVQSNDPELPAGTNVMGLLGWQDFSVIDGRGAFFMPLPDDSRASPVMQLALLGPVGVAAYFALIEVARPRAGDVLVVSAAGSAVGSLAGQIGKLLGCRVVGITSSQDKCRWLTGDLGFDAAIDYRIESVFKRLRELCPDGIDIYFDGVGGSLLEDALNLLRQRARVVMVGMISAYNDRGGTLTLPAGPNNLLNLTLKRARMEGFVCLDWWHRAGEAVEALTDWHRQGRLKYGAEIVQGLHNAPRMLRRLFDGSNRGKLVLEIQE
jgi:NADPH-dependent curcumin reductase CurA